MSAPVVVRTCSAGDDAWLHGCRQANAPQGLSYNWRPKEGENDLEALAKHDSPEWQRQDRAAFGIIYGSITVLSILMARGSHPEAPLQTAALLFGSVLAITLAKAFAELMAHAIETGERISRQAWRAVWRHSRVTLAAANAPTLLFVAAAVGWLPLKLAVLLSHSVCILLLLVMGARAGWVIDGKVVPAILGGLFTGSIGAALSLAKLITH